MTNNELLLESLDMVEEKRDEADLRALRHKQQVARYYNKKVRARTFEPGDLVLKRVFAPQYIWARNGKDRTPFYEGLIMELSS